MSAPVTRPGAAERPEERSSFLRIWPLALTVLVPTRNRARLAAEAVASAASSGHLRVRVVVSDNSTDAAEREELARRLDDACLPRVELIHPPRPLDMSAHWEWALGRALEDGTATHVAVLTDRMLVRPGALSLLMGAALEHPDTVVSYPYDTVLDHARPVHVDEHPWTGRMLRVSSAHLLRMTARGELSIALPRLLNCVVPRGAFTRVEAAFGSRVGPVAPDITFAFRCLDVVDEIAYYDRALLIQRGIARSNGWAQLRGIPNDDHRDWVRALGGEHAAASLEAPAPEILTVGNTVFGCYEHVRRRSSSGKLPPLTRDGYLGALAVDVGRIEDEELRRRLEARLAALGWDGRLSRRRRAQLRARAVAFAARRPSLRLRGSPAQPAPRQHGTPEAAVEELIAHPRPRCAHSGHLLPLLEPRGVARETAPPAPLPPEGEAPLWDLPMMTGHVAGAPRACPPAEAGAQRRERILASLEQRSVHEVKRFRGLDPTRSWESDVVAVRDELPALVRALGPRRAAQAARARPAGAADGPAGPEASRRLLHAQYVAGLYELALRLGPPGFLASLDEPELGRPVMIRHRGRRISEDLARSALEYASATSAGAVRGPVLHVAPGYGRLPWLFLALGTGARHWIVDDPPQLAISTWYLTSLFGERLRVAPFALTGDPEELAAHAATADVVFLTPDQLEALPAVGAELAVLVGALDERSPSRVAGILDVLPRHVAGGLLYLKDLPPLPAAELGEPLLNRRAPGQRAFAEALVRVPA